MTEKFEAGPKTKALRAKNFLARAEEEKDPKLKEDLLLSYDIAQAVKEAGGRALVVGGFARDEVLRLMGRAVPHDERSQVPAGTWRSEFYAEVTSKDIDLEIYGIEFGELATILAQFGEPNPVGEHFKVIMVGRVDITLPRRDSKIGPGHRGFHIEDDPSMSFKEAARRRDFTVNAIALDPLTGEFIDEWGGIEDLRRGLLRVTDPERFADDPLRVLRAAQFAARFGFRIASETAELCRSINLHELSKERIGGEWKKILTAPSPSRGLKTALELGVLDQLHSELKAIATVPQKWEHLCTAVDTAVGIARGRSLEEQETEAVVLATLCLSFEETGAVRFLSQINPSKSLRNKVTRLVGEYSVMATVIDVSRDEEIQRLAFRLHPANIRELCLVAKANLVGKKSAGIEGLLKKAEKLGVGEGSPAPILMGRHLVKMGFPPGPSYGKVLREVFEAQLKGEIKDLEEAKKLSRELWRGV